MLKGCAHNFRLLDKFGRNPGFKVRYDSNNIYLSYMGALCSLILIILVLTYTFSKLMILINSSKIDLVSNYDIGALTYEDKFTGEDGFFVAAALTNYDDETEPLYDSRYGDLTLEHHGWDSLRLETSSTALPTHSCSDEELGLDANAEFPIFAGSFNEVKTWKKKFRCTNNENLVIYGDYNSPKAQQFSIKFKFCDASKRSDCHSKEET